MHTKKLLIITSILLLSATLTVITKADPPENPIINEFELNPPGNDNYLIIEEWVELYNPTPESMDIGGWTLSTTSGETVTATIPEDTKITAGGYYIHSRMSMWLDNENESIILRNASGEEIDRTPVRSDTENNNYTWSRTPNGRDTDTDADWKYQLNTMGAPNRGETSISSLCPAVPLSQNITIHFIDVGQGDSIFIDTPDHDMLIDGGDKKAGDAVIDYLQDLGITRIDIVVATHPDSDHIGGLIQVLTTYNASTAPMVIDSGYLHDTKTYKDYNATLINREYLIAERGYSFLLDECVNITILNPTSPHEFKTTNENSVVLRMTIGQVAFLFEGDAEEDAEDSMLDSGLELSSSILKVGHHGSESSTTQEFLNAVTPDIAIISVGEGNKYEHPSSWTLKKLETSEATILRTDQNGDIIITTDGVKTWVTIEKTNQSTPILAATILTAGAIILIKTRPRIT